METSFFLTCKGMIQKNVTYYSITSLLDNTKKYNFDFGSWRRCYFNDMIDISCLYVTVDKSMITYLIAGNLKYYLVGGTTENKLSWNKGYELCQHFGADLPSFMSRDELDELIALLLKSQTIPFLEAIFIGLRINDANVSKFIII